VWGRNAKTPPPNAVQFHPESVLTPEGLGIVERRDGWGLLGVIDAVLGVARQSVNLLYV